MYYSVSLLRFGRQQRAKGKIHNGMGFVRPIPCRVENSGKCAAE